MIRDLKNSKCHIAEIFNSKFQQLQLRKIPRSKKEYFFYKINFEKEYLAHLYLVAHVNADDNNLLAE